MDGMYVERHSDLIFYRWKIFEEYAANFTAVMTTRNRNQNNTVKKNWEDICSALNFPQSPMAMGHQVHGTRISGPEFIKNPPYPECDAVSLSKPNILAGVLLADCHPIILFDPVKHRALVAHAGWRGTLAGMATKGVQFLQERGSQPCDVLAATGPGIGSCCYIIGDDVATRFAELRWPSKNYLTQKGHHWHLSLEDVNVLYLLESGILRQNIGRGQFCTACGNQHFHSHRRDHGHPGRHAALIGLH